MIIQTGTKILWKRPGGTALQQIDAVEQIDDLIDRTRVTVRTEISGAVLHHSPGLQYPRKILFHSHFYIGISLIIPQKHIVLRHILLNQIAL